MARTDGIPDPLTTQAHAGWILAENWWPYQRPTFVTPPFPGYISGHSTYSRAAAEVLTRLTGNEYFPGGMSEFEIHGERVPRVRGRPERRHDAAVGDVSRCGGAERALAHLGRHPPADRRHPGRRIGIEVGNDAYDYALTYFD